MSTDTDTDPDNAPLAPAPASPRSPRLALPSAPPLVRGLLALIIGMYLVYSSFGIAGPFLWGHHGYHGATYAQRARMTLRYHIITPATWNGSSLPPEPQSFYLHHPIGYHHVLVPFMALLGESEWVIRGVAVLGGVPLLLALFALVRRFWDDYAALLACAVYVALPVVCSFSVLSDPMLLEMTCSLIALHAFLRYLQAPSRRVLAIGCAALTVGGLLMWEVYFQAFFHGLYVLGLLCTARGRAARLPLSARHPERSVNAGAAWFLATFVCTSAAMAFHFLFTWKVGVLGDFFSSFKERSTAGWPWVIAQHRLWLDLLYGTPLLAIGALWLVVFLVRLLCGKARLRDQAVLLFFLINTLYIFLFRKGSSIHLYRVYYFSTFFALAVTDLVSEARALLARRFGARPARLFAAALSIAYFATVGPHALHNLIESREVMGTHGHKGYNPEYQKLLFARAAAEHTDKYAFAVFYNLPYRLEFTYYFDRSYGVSPWGEIGTLAQLPAIQKRHPDLALMTQRPLPPGENRLLDALLQKHDAYAYDNYLLVRLDHETDKPQLHTYRFVPRRASWVWWWFYSHKYPPMQIEEVMPPKTPAPPPAPPPPPPSPPK
jgi:4-amino-4-deoxy-L-arabinose transferase-like glycosyltransferase